MTFFTSYRTFNCALYHIFKTRLNCFLQCDRNWKTQMVCEEREGTKCVMMIVFLSTLR